MRMAMRVATVFLGVSACSSSSSPSTPNLDTGKTLVSLSASEQATLCDWQAAQYGGYGKSVSCGGGIAQPLHGPTDQASCIRGMPPQTPSSMMYCTATVGQFEQCVTWTVHNGCTSSMQPADCAALRNPNCM